MILAALLADDYERLCGLLEVHPLRMRETLQEAGDPTDYVYFPTSGSISVLTVLENGMMIEFATVGREGTTGVPLFLGIGGSNMALISQVPGEALRIRAEDFLREIARNRPCVDPDALQRPLARPRRAVFRLQPRPPRGRALCPLVAHDP